MKRIQVFLLGILTVLFASVGHSQTPTAPVIRLVTNNLAGPTGFQSTNTLIQITNGTLAVTSAPVAIYRGRGAAISVGFTPTCASCLTNLYLNFDVSIDGTNWSFGQPAGTPFLQWGFNNGQSSNFLGATKFTALTNLLADKLDNFRYIRLHSIVVTNNGTVNPGILITNNDVKISVIP